MPARLVTAPSGEPVTLAEAKAHLRLETSLDDAYVSTLISSARHHVEEVCWRGLLTQTWELVLPGFVGDDRRELVDGAGGGRAAFIELPRGQVGTLAADAVKYVDIDGVERTLAATEYDVDDVSVPGRLRLAYGKSWPQTREQWDAVRIRYPVGWANAAAVPPPIKQAMLLLISDMYENRSTTPQDTAAADALLSPHRLLRL